MSSKITIDASVLQTFRGGIDYLSATEFGVSIFLFKSFTFLFNILLLLELRTVIMISKILIVFEMGQPI